MMKSNWSRALTLAATGLLADGVSNNANAATPYQIRADWLDPGVSADHSAQQLIIDELAQGYPINDDRLDDYGLTEAAATAIRQARNAGDFPGARLGEKSSQWWQRAEPALTDTMAARAAIEAERQKERAQWAWHMTLGTFAVAGALAAYDVYQRRTPPRGPGGGGGKPKLVYRNPDLDVPSAKAPAAAPTPRFGTGP